jgi:hypothetical protein
MGGKNLSSAFCSLEKTPVAKRAKASRSEQNHPKRAACSLETSSDATTLESLLPFGASYSFGASLVLGVWRLVFLLVHSHNPFLRLGMTCITVGSYARSPARTASASDQNPSA